MATVPTAGPSTTSQSPPTSLDRPRLLAIIDSWEQQLDHLHDASQICLKTNSCMMFYTLRLKFDSPMLTHIDRPSFDHWSEDELLRLQKAMITRPSQKWNDATHLRICKITRSVTFQQEKAMRERQKDWDQQERVRKLEKGLTENCRGCGCGSSACESCYMSDWSGEMSRGMDSDEESESFREDAESTESLERPEQRPRKRTRSVSSVEGSESMDGCEESEQGPRKRMRRKENCGGDLAAGCGCCVACESLQIKNMEPQRMARDLGPKSGEEGQSPIASHSDSGADGSFEGQQSEVERSEDSDEDNENEATANHRSRFSQANPHRKVDCHGCGCGSLGCRSCYRG